MDHPASNSVPPLLLTSLQTSHFPLPSPAFLHPILHPSTHLPPPLPALVATTKHRLLSSSLTSPHLLSPSTSSLPATLCNALVEEAILDVDVPVQVLDIEDMGRSKGDLLLEIESERLGERIKGREVIRVIDDAAAQQAQTQTQTQTQTQHPRLANSPGPFKLLLQDYKGGTIYGYETMHVEKIGFPPKMHIGCKIMLKSGTRVCRGMVWLEERTCVVLGGRVEGLDSVWREGWERRLREQLGRRGE